MPTKEKPAKKTPSLKEKIAENAKKIQALAAKKPSKKAPAKKKEETKTEVLAPLAVPTDVIDDILTRCVTVDDAHSAIVIGPETTGGEFVRILDHLTNEAEASNYRIGDAVVQGRELAAFDGKFDIIMASLNRPIETLKQFERAAKAIPPNLRNLHPAIKWTHGHALAGVPKLEDREKILRDAVTAAEKHKPLTVAQVKEKAAKVTPKKNKKAKVSVPNNKKPERIIREMTVDEREVFDNLEHHAAMLEAIIGGASFVLELSTDDTLTLREKLGAIARFNGQLAV